MLSKQQAAGKAGMGINLRRRWISQVGANAVQLAAGMEIRWQSPNRVLQMKNRQCPNQPDTIIIKKL
jgi:hypothetical protein